MRRLASNLRDVWDVMTAEVRRVFSDSATLILFFIATLVYPPLYYYVYNHEVVRDMPVAVVDLSQSEASKRFVHKLDATPEMRVAYRAATLDEGRRMLCDHKVRAVVLLPADYGTRLAADMTAQVTCYSDISSYYYYKNAMQGGNDVLLDEMHTIELLHQAAEGLVGEQAEAQVQPLVFDGVTLYNPASGYATYFIPALLLLVVHQTLFLGICELCGEAAEDRKALRLIPARLRAHSTYRVTTGRLLCFMLIYIPVTLFDLWIVPRVCGLPQLGSGWTMVLFLLPFVMATACFGMTFGNLFSRKRMSTLMCTLFFSVILYLLSGIVWPQCSMPRFWLWFSYIFPSTPGIQGFVRITSLGASLADVRREYMALWAQTGVYFFTACLSLKFIKLFKK